MEKFPTYVTNFLNEIFLIHQTIRNIDRKIESICEYSQAERMQS